MKMLQNTKDKFVKKITYIFLSWQLLLLLASVFAITNIPLAGKIFLGGGAINYLKNPLLLGWANFDGEHYLAIATVGYKGLEQAFFPIYPLLIRLLASPFGINLNSLTVAGLIISNISLLFALIFLFKLLKLDYSINFSLLVIILLLVFPTSFYFHAFYSESLFLLFSVVSFYFARKDRWIIATIFGIFASATRIFGFLLLPAFILEAWQRKVKFRNFFWIIFIPVGLLAYMFYQWFTVGDPLAFYHLQKLVGQQHQSSFTLLPQVYFRYIKILATVNFADPIYQTIVLELIIGFFFVMLPVYGYFKKIRWSYLFYSLIGFLLPTIQGSFSSVPRYVIVFFPGFIALAFLFSSMPRWLRIIFIALSLIWLIIETSLFFRGYWIA